MATRNDFIVVPGRLLFEDIYTPVIPPKANPANGTRFSATLQVSKSAKAVSDLFDLVAEVAEATWGAQSGKYLANIQASIDDGWPPSKGLVSIRDGDHENNQPERNRGFYLVSASRYSKRGPVGVFGVDGAPLAGACAEAPKPGDGVLMLINVWAQPQYDRVNFTLESVRKAVEGEALGGGPSAADREAALTAFSSVALPSSIEGVKAAPSLAAQAGGQPAGWGARASVPTNSPKAEPAPPAPPTGRRLVKSL